MEQENKIVICMACQGTGLEYARNANGSISVYRGKPITKPCSVCDGERCLLERITKEYFKVNQNVVAEEPIQKKGGFSWLKSLKERLN